MVTSRTVRAAQKVSREGGAIAVTPAGEARHGCFSHSQGCAEGFKRGMCDSCDIGGSKAWLLLAQSGLRRRFHEREVR